MTGRATRLRRVLAPALATLGAMAAAAPLAAQGAARDTAKAVIKPRTMYEDLQMFSGVLNQIRTNHPDTVDAHRLIMAAIEAMVHAADPHSVVFPSYRYDAQKEKAMRAGKLYPVPISFAYAGGAPVVVGVVPGSSAAKAGVLPGDELIGIDGQPVLAESAEELDVTLAGAKNSSVRLTFDRRRSDGSLVQLERTVKRERVGEGTAVPTAFMLDPQTGYVRLTTFMNSKVADDLHDALGRLEKQGMKRLVLDMRDNGGGSVDEAAKVAGEFLPKGALVYTAAGRKREVTDTVRVERSFWSREKRYPIVVMLNSHSASATELVAGALQDHDRALIVGRPSFGKSLLMYGMLLPDGSWMSMVVGHVKTPCGRVIQRQYRGITRRDYFRLARAERDTAGRPSCKTAGGRTVYGGGGIYPDVPFPEREPLPVWASRVSEEALPLKWIAGHLGAHGGEYPSVEAVVARPQLSAAALADFRRFAAEQGVTIPPGEEADRVLTQTLLPYIVETKWGEDAFYRVLAVTDPQVRMAVDAFGRAEAILK